MSKWKNMPDQDAGRGLCTEQLASHTQELGGGRGLQEANTKHMPKGLDPSGPCLPALGKGAAGSSWGVPSWISSEKTIMSAPSTLTSLVPPPRQHPPLLPPATQHSSHIYFWTAQGPISSYTGSNALLALPHKGPILAVLAIRSPSPHCLHTLELPASTLPLEWGKQPLPTPSDLKLNSVLWGWCLRSTLNYRMTHQKSRCYRGEPKLNHKRGSLKPALPPEPHTAFLGCPPLPLPCLLAHWDIKNPVMHMQ